MAQYQHLSIYKSAYDLLVQLMQVTRDFPRDYKFSLGEKIQNTVIELLISIYKANSAVDKKLYIQEILQKVQFLNIYLRISCDIKILPNAKYCALIQIACSISKQAQGWLKSTQNSEPEPVCAKA